MSATDPLPPLFEGWFSSQGWAPHAHQLEMIACARAGRSALLIAPTGGGKTLSGFLPSLIELAESRLAGVAGLKRAGIGLHTLYISPLKALAVDVHRNLDRPIAQMRLPIRAGKRTGDTPQAERDKQRRDPPQILMTTPESLALMLSYPDAGDLFGHLSCVIIDELHALGGTKRGDLLALALARLSRLAPDARRVGLSATVADEAALLAYLSKHGTAAGGDVTIVRGRTGASAKVGILRTAERLPWSGHMGLHAAKEIYQLITGHGITIVFVNTRAQAEMLFQDLWHANDDALPIALHHGSLDAGQRKRVEAAMASGRLRAVVATASLDLGIDWAAVDLVVQVGAPKGVSRLLQRIGRANHRLDQPSKALMVPANRFEFLECQAALDAIHAGELDGAPAPAGALDVLAQHLLACACSAPFDADDLYGEVTRAAPYHGLTRAEFEDVLDFVATGGYALRAYERYAKLKQTADGRWAIAGPWVARQYRMNNGTIVEATTLKVKLGRGKVLGEIEEYFAQGLVPGDTFMFAGQLLEFTGIRDMAVTCRQGGSGEPKVPAYAGGRLPLSTYLADRVRAILADPGRWDGLSDPVREWLALQRARSVLPARDRLLIETFPRGGKHYTVAYTFEGRNAHQTLGMLLTRRMERAGLGPLGFVATDYVFCVWSLDPPTPDVLARLFDQDMLGDDLEAWLVESSIVKRSFRHVAVISGLIERRHPGLEKSGRQVTVNADLIYDVLARHQPDHVLLRATWADAARGLIDLARVADLLRRIKGRIVVKALDRVSPLAVPVILEIGKEWVPGTARDRLLKEAEDDLLAEAMPELFGQARGDGQGALPL